MLCQGYITPPPPPPLAGYLPPLEILLYIYCQGLIQDFLLGGGGGGGGNHIFEEILDIFGQQNRRVQLYNFSNCILIGYRPV